jgi:sulfate adenylyltransferase subunit 1
MAEREQGITIDVAHLYMTYKNTRIIWADAPGHEEYTRNMVTAAAGAHAALLLTDVSRPLTSQFKKHLQVLQILQIPNVLVVVNKLDRLNYSLEAYDERRMEINSLLQNSSGQKVEFLPASAWDGVNLVQLNTQLFPNNSLTVMKWIESLSPNQNQTAPFYAQVQAPVHHGGEQRRYQVWVYQGKLKNGEMLHLGNGGKRVGVKGIFKFGTPVEEALAGQAIELELDRDVDLSRGTELTKEETEHSEHITTELFNLDHGQDLIPRKPYRLKRGLFESKVRIETTDGGTTIGNNEHRRAKLRLAQPLSIINSFDTESRSFILIDDSSNSTCAVGVMVE